MNLSAIAVSSVAAATAILLTSCSAAPEPKPAPPAAQPDSPVDYPPVPTPVQLNEDLARAFDPSVPLGEKVRFVQGASDDPALIDQVVAAAVANSASAEVTSVDDLGDGTVNAGAILTIGGQPNPTSLTFVAEDGVWKLSRENACTIVDLAGLTTPACDG